ncbi:MAG: 50S ribosomal protein L24 [Candidatus Diapherotrites archaeon]|nr:50S ribosomal protein L24 [Candidatus Diapherotrites archaeon]
MTNIKSKKPSKQRKKRFTSKQHEKVKLYRVHVSKELQKTIKKKTIGLKKEDKVKVMRGAQKGKTGKVMRINRNKEQVFIEKIVRKKSDGTETMIPIHPSNLLLLESKDEKSKPQPKKEEKVK